VTTLDGKHLSDYLAIAGMLRQAGINTEVYLEAGKLKQQLAYANRKGFQVAVIAGEDEFGRNEVQVKNLATQVARAIPRSEVVAAVKAAVKTSVGGSS